MIETAAAQRGGRAGLRPLPLFFCDTCIPSEARAKGRLAGSLLFPTSRQEPRGLTDVASDDPMMASVAGRYASALFDLASEERQLSEVEAGMGALRRMLDESEDLRRMVASPLLGADEQAKAIGAVLQKSGASPLLSNFVQVVARNRRLFTLPDILKSFRSLLARHRGEVSADVTSATALTDAQLDQLKDMLRVEVGKEVSVDTKVDPALLGGLVVKIGSRMIDSSLRTKLDTLKTRMKEVN